MKKQERSKWTVQIRQGLAMLLVAVMLVGYLLPGGAAATEDPTEGTTAPVETVPETTGSADETVPETTGAAATEPEATTAPTQPEETVPETTAAAEETVPETTAPVETQPTLNSGTPTVPQQSAYEKAMADLTAMEEEAKTLEPTLDVLNAFFFDRLMAAWDAAQLMWEKDGLTDDEFNAINEKAQSIVNYLHDEYGYENGRILADGSIGIINNATNINAIVKIFNYDSSVNSKGLGPAGYTFYHSLGYDDYMDAPTNEETGSSVDGVGTSATVGNPKMKQTLHNGYPYSEECEGSMDYLFDGTYLQGTMTNGGGLFQTKGGYYIYDSLVNAAWYNKAANRFTLYDVAISPPYTQTYYANTGSGAGDVQSGNFLPFNEVSASTAKAETVTQADGTPRYSLTKSVDVWFGMTVEFDFNMPTGGKMDGKDMEFDFYGDDDVFVYIDDILVLDIGGCHGAEGAAINFATGEVTTPTGADRLGERLPDLLAAANLKKTTLYSIMKVSGATVNDNDFVDVDGDGELDTFKNWTNHNLKFFYMERGGNISYCRLKFNMEPLPKGNVQVKKELDNNVVTSYGENLEFTFTLTDKDEGTPIANSSYTIAGDATVRKTDKNGQFVLKAGQTAYFSELESKNTYLVEEVESLVADLSHIKYNGDVIYNGTTDTENEGFYIDPDESNKVHAVVFTNTLEDTAFTVSKTVAGNLGDQSKNFSFTAELKHADGTHIDFPAPEGDETYTLDSNQNAAFTLKHDTSMTFDNIPVGVDVVVTESDYTTEATGKYKTSAKVNGAAAVEGLSAALDTVVAPTAQVPNTIAFINHKDVVIDTGIALDSMPYVLILVCVVAAGAVLVMGKRRRYGED